jgi:superfamily II DNA or RNA helicase
MKPDKLAVGQTILSAHFSEPVRIETINQTSPSIWQLGVVGLQSDKFRKVTFSDKEIIELRILENSYTYSGDAKLLRLGLQAYALGIAYEYDPYFGLSISRVDPLPHQLEAVYDYLLKLARIKFLLADDAGAGKTIMAGLLIRELGLRGLAERILIVCPANLAFQWQRELKEKFDEKFLVVKGNDIRDQFGVNQWLEQKKVITSLDLAKREDILPGLKQSHWDLIIVDEAHRMSWSPPSKKTARYALGELLRDASDHTLLLTATPHRGDPVNFSLFLQLLDADAYADVKSIREAIEKRRAPFYLRRTKEAMVYFPERRPDGTWAAEKIFTKRIPHTVDFQIDGDEFELYREVTRFVKHQSNLAAARGDDPRARAVGFLMGLYQRRLASSTYSLRHSLENRAKRLEDNLSKALVLASTAPIDLPEPEEIEEMEEFEQQKLEDMLSAISLANNAEAVKLEIQELRDLAKVAKKVEDAGVEAKLTKLKDLMHKEGFFDNQDKRLLIFTEFKDTLDYLLERFKSWGFSVGCIHGSMKPGSREEPGTRLYSEQQFKEGGIQILVATEAAGEGINLQFCNMLFNYDIPWNPNRLEQRMGRIHRYGQKKNCLIFNFVATNTIEGRVLQKLLEKLQEIRDALDDDAVFNVIGEVLPAAHVERILRDYYAGKLGDEDLEDRLLKDVDEQQFKSICQNALEGLASKKLNLKMLVERRAKAQERRVVPETIARFMHEAAEYVPLRLRIIDKLAHAFEPARIPSTLKKYENSPDWRLPAVASKYPVCSADRDTAEKNNLEWVTPGHPLFESIRRHALDKSIEPLALGACFYSLEATQPQRIDFYRARIVDGLGTVIHERMFALILSEQESPRLTDTAVLGDFQPTTAPVHISTIATMPEQIEWLNSNALLPFLEETRKERVGELDRIEAHVEMSLTELLQNADDEIGKAAADAEQKLTGSEGRLAQAETRHSELLNRRDKRRLEMARQKALSLQAVQRVTSIIILPHPEREAPDVKRLRRNFETERIAMDIVIQYENNRNCQVFDVHEKNLGYDITSLDLQSGELRLIEIKGIGDSTGTVLLTPNERRVAQDRRDCYWLYIVTNCSTAPVLQEPLRDPARLQWHEVKKVEHYYLNIDAISNPMQVREDRQPYGEKPQ